MERGHAIPKIRCGGRVRHLPAVLRPRRWRSCARSLMSRASASRSPSCRIRPTPPFSTSSSRVGASVSSGTARCNPVRFSISLLRSPAAASAACSAWRSRLTSRRAGGSSSTSRIRTATRWWRGSSDRRTRWSRIRRRASTSCGQPASASSGSRSPITTAATWFSDRTAFSTSAWATAAAATIPNNNAQNPASLLGKILRIDVSVPDSNAAGFSIPADNPFRSSSRAGNLGLRRAQPVAVQLRRPGARRHRCAGHRRRRPGPDRRSRLRAGGSRRA